MLCKVNGMSTGCFPRLPRETSICSLLRGFAESAVSRRYNQRESSEAGIKLAGAGRAAPATHLGYPVVRLDGAGILKETPDPCKAMRTVFLANGWEEDPSYAADLHGSSSAAYRKGTRCCMASVEVVSSCAVAETGH